MKNILIRAVNVLYIFLLLLGVVIGLVIWKINQPEYSTYTYSVVCSNGKIFDPTSKPITTSSNYDRRPIIFLDFSIAAECVHGDASRYSKADFSDQDFSEILYRNLGNNLNYSNKFYKLSTIAHPYMPILIYKTLTFLVIYYLVLETLRRAYLYVFFGKPFISFKKNV